MKNGIELLRAANKYKPVTAEIEIPLDGEDTLKVILHAPDIFAIQEEQEIVYQLKLAECVSKGMQKYPVPESEWVKEMLDLISEVDRDKVFKITHKPKESTIYSTVAEDMRKYLLKNKPSNLAELTAQRISKIQTVRELIPKFLKTSEGEPLIQTAEDHEYFKEVMANNLPLFTEITRAYTGLVKQMTEKREAVKN